MDLDYGHAVRARMLQSFGRLDVSVPSPLTSPAFASVPPRRRPPMGTESSTLVNKPGALGVESARDATLMSGDRRRRQAAVCIYLARTR